MKKSIALKCLLLCLLLLLMSACGGKDNNSGNILPSEDAGSTPVISTQPPVSDIPEDDITPTPDVTPPSGITDMLRPEKGTIHVTDGTGSEDIEAELVYQNLNASNPFLAFSIYSDVSGYELINDEGVYSFRKKGGDSELVYLEISYIMGIDAEALKPSFVDDYIDFTDISFTSFSRVGQEDIECTAITASGRDQYVEAYLANVEYGVVAIVLSSNADNDYDANMLSAMLDTLILHEMQ